MMVVTPEATDEEVAALSERISGIVTGRGGSIHRDDHWGLRRLAYPIQRFQEGNYILKQFAVDPATVVDLDKTLTASEQILRHLVVKIDAPPPPPPPAPVAAAPEAEPEATAEEEEAAPAAEEAPESSEAEASEADADEEKTEA
jgi:small subunit ribosomal protein S6